MFGKLLVLVVLNLLLLSFIEARHLEESQENQDVVPKPGGSIWRRKRATETTTKDDSTSESVHFTSAEAMGLMKFFLKAGWEAKKEEMLADFIDEIADSDTNMTVIGWQHIYGDDGTVEQINSIQFVVSPKPETDDVGNFEADSEEDEDEDENNFDIPHEQLKEMREILQPFSLLGIPTFITYQEFDESGKESNILYMDENEIYANNEGFAIYNRTVPNATPDDIKKSVDNAKKYRGHTVAKFDQDWNFIEGEIHPLLLGNVLGYEEAVNEVYVAAPGIMADVAVKSGNKNVPKELATRFNHDFPTYKWRVLVDPSDSHVTQDISLTLSMDNFDFYENSGASYFVYGVKK